MEPVQLGVLRTVGIQKQYRDNKTTYHKVTAYRICHLDIHVVMKSEHFSSWDAHSNHLQNLPDPAPRCFQKHTSDNAFVKQ